ncbi:MAG: trigger factor [Pseudomonadota bacterium]|nr:trigger factor [Pseudomonadota bacterium]
MQITETKTEGLRREFRVVCPAGEARKSMEGRLRKVGETARLPGFRPGKAPMALLEQRYGQSVMGEVLEDLVEEGAQKALKDRGLRMALRPKVEVKSWGMDKDLEYTIAVEILPDVDPGDLSGIALERPVAVVADSAVDQALERLAKSRATTNPVSRAAAMGDTVVVDFRGTADGKEWPGMKAGGAHLELGAKRLVDTFEDQLVGAKAGDHRKVTVTFPADYGATELAGKQGIFEVDVKEVRESVPPVLDDALAKDLGLESLDEMKKLVRERLGEDYARVARLKVKRQLLDSLADRHSFAIPEGMVDLEFSGIWSRLQEELRRDGSAAGKAKSEEELKKEYRSIAERRVRLGLLLAEVGRRNNIHVAREELNQAMFREMQRFPGQEKQVMEYFRNNPQAMDSLRAPLFEDKVVDFIVTQAKVSDRNVSVDELMKDPEAEAA